MTVWTSESEGMSSSTVVAVVVCVLIIVIMFGFDSTLGVACCLDWLGLVQSQHYLMKLLTVGAILDSHNNQSEVVHSHGR
jgi:hypothetical protein